MSRRLAALGSQTGSLGLAYFTIGAVCGAVPRAAEAAMISHRLPPFQLIRLGALSNGALFGMLGGALIPAIFLVHSFGVLPILDPSRVPVAGELVASGFLCGGIAVLATWPLQRRADCAWAAPQSLLGWD
ncbi:hypothetical protein C8F01DRAFT_1375686 [Mycena amicta]|nr:hypothetical protein C8F01DRAFT_1375686 [Mycena amicta]